MAEDNICKYSFLDNSFFTLDKANVCSFNLLYCNIRSMSKNFNMFMAEFAQTKEKIILLL